MCVCLCMCEYMTHRAITHVARTHNSHTARDISRGQSAWRTESRARSPHVTHTHTIRTRVARKCQRTTKHPYSISCVCTKRTHNHHRAHLNVRIHRKCTLARVVAVAADATVATACAVRCLRGRQAYIRVQPNDYDYFRKGGNRLIYV